MSTVFQSVFSESGGGQDPFAMCVYGRRPGNPPTPGKLVFFGQYGELKLNAIDLKTVNLDGTMATPQAQENIQFEQFRINQSYQTLHSESPSACSAIEVGTYLCLLWNDDRKGVMCAVCNPDDAFSPPRSWYTMRTAGSASLRDHVDKNYDVAATPIDPTSFLLATHYNVPGRRVIHIGYYRLSDRVDPPKLSDEPGTWNAAAEWTVEYDAITQQALGTSGLDTSLRMEWYSYGVPEKPTSKPTCWLALALFNPGARRAAVGFLAMDIASLPTILIGGIPGGAVAKASDGPASGAFDSRQPVSFGRDSGGYLRIYATGRDQRDRSFVNITIMPGVSAPDLKQSRLVTLGDCVPMSQQRDVLDINLPIVPVFIVSQQDVATTMSPDDPGYIPDLRVIAYPAAETVFAHSPGRLNSFASTIGRVQTLADFQIGSTEHSSVLIARGVFDGPFPAPGVQLEPYFGTNISFADVKYGTLAQQTSTREDTATYSVGQRFDVRTTEGVGPAIEESFKATYRSFASFSNTVVKLDDITQRLTQRPEPPHDVVANGTVFGNAMNLVTDAVRFLVPDPKNNNQFILDLKSSILARIWGSPTGQVNAGYDPYAVVPGDVASYTREAWNAKLQQLGYSTATYFEDIVLPAAFVFPNTGADVKKNYLELSLSVGSGSSTSVDLSSVDVSESGWTFDASIYGGVQVDKGVKLFGFGEAFQLSFLVGIETNQSWNNITSKTTSWGIKVNTEGLPAPARDIETPNGTDGVESYTVRVYFLHPSTLWTKELMAFGTGDLVKRLDPGSAPWRIVYEVAQYRLSNGVTYPPPHKPGSPDRGPAIEAGKFKYRSTSSTVWEKAPVSVRYYVAFANAAGETPSVYSEAAQISGGACPQISIPYDTASPSLTTRRLIYRNINGRDRLVKTVLGNDPAVDKVYDDEPAANFIVVGKPSIASPDSWGGRVVGDSDVWKTGNYVSYRVAYAFAPENGIHDRTPADWFPQSALSDSTDAALIGIYANCKLTGIPVFPSGTDLPRCVGRKIYRTAAVSKDSNPFQTDFFVGYIADNTTTDFVDYMK